LKIAGVVNDYKEALDIEDIVKAFVIKKRIFYLLSLEKSKENIIEKSNKISSQANDIGYSENPNKKNEQIKNEDEITKSYDDLMKIPAQTKKSISVQKMAHEPITELIIGMTTDAQFGPALMFGIGGILVELLEDVSFRIAPITEYDAREQIHEIKGFPILDGYRGKPKADIDAIVNTLLKISDLVTKYEEINEMDLNPVFIYEKGLVCVDARIILKRPEKKD